ncbi:capsid cement protein [Vibrio lentus]|uniref:Uncharacterized protein n=1 Tax=Vibrio tasmaniensis TaxID=212663 RepID=A0A0H3ZTP7_9VIBR|nr:capsid cement protein [Vibrio lentus]AKN39728.1 hypothetical protein [Vibrio tasmaniensis]PMI58297.1 hypothetical protein BCU41_03955 [Vibrio lentus]
MHQQAEGKNLTLIAAAKITSGEPMLYGARVVIPTVTVEAGRPFAAETSGVYLGVEDHIVDGLTPDYEGENAYWIVADSKLTTAKTTDSKANLHVGYFVTNFNEQALELGI